MYRAVPLLFLLAACTRPDGSAGSDTATPRTEGETQGAATTASATLRDLSGREIGTVALSDADSGVVVEGTLTGLAPGERGIHLHAVGRCEPPFESAGPHWNPDRRRHGTLGAGGAHRGDLPNLVIGADSSGALRGTSAGGALRGADGLLDADGAAVVVHEGADDYRTDPSGNSGKRVACGVVSARR